MKKVLTITLATMLLLLVFSCSSDDNDWTGEQFPTDFNNGTASSSASTAGDLDNLTIAIDTTALSETETVPSDDEDYIENNTFGNVIEIYYNGSSATVTGSVDGVTVSTSGAHVSVTSTVKGVCYSLSGTTTDGSFKIQSSAKKYEILMNGVNITNPTGAAINSQSGKRGYIVLADGTFNTLTDGTSYTIPDGEDMKGTMFSEGELLFSGSGKLRVYSNTKHGIVSDDYIMFRPNNNIYVKSTSGNGIKANDGILVKGGVINVETSATAAKGLNSEGYFQMDGGRVIAITTGDGEYDSDDKDAKGSAGVKCDSIFVMNGGDLYCKSTGTGGKGISTDQTLTVNDGTIKVITTGKTYTYGSVDAKPKGIKSDGDMTFNGGDIMVKCTGTDDGAEGIESKALMTINSGKIEVYAYDDALNSSSHMYIKGGYIYAFSVNNDGLDSNGNMYIQGGTTVAYGTSAPESGIDANEEEGYSVIVSGGTLAAVGGSTSYPSSSSTQPSIVYGGSVSSGTTVALNSGNTNILALKMGRAYNGSAVFFFTSPSLSKGNAYTIYTGATASGTDWHGLYTGATLSSTGNSAATISSLALPYSSAGQTQGAGGGNPGGGPGGR